MIKNNLNEVWFRSILKENYLKNFDSGIQNQVLHFIENGYIIFENNFDINMLDSVANSKTIQYEGKEGQPLRALHAWKYIENVKKIAINKNIINFIEILYQRKAIPFLTTNFKYGSQVPPHTDAIKYQTFPDGFMCAVWTAIEDVDEENGVIELYPKSHLLPYIYLDKTGNIAKNAKNRYAFYKDYEEYLKLFIESKKLEKKAIPLKKGQSIIWDCNLIHAGAKILDKDRTRYSQVTHYFFEDCVYYAPLFSDIALGNIYYWKVINILNNSIVKHNYFGHILKLKNSFFKEKMNELY